MAEYIDEDELLNMPSMIEDMAREMQGEEGPTLPSPPSTTTSSASAAPSVSSQRIFSSATNAIETITSSISDLSFLPFPKTLGSASLFPTMTPRNQNERIEEIEQHDESSRVLSQNDFIAQIFEKKKSGRVRGVGFGPTPSQLFGPNLHGPGNEVQLKKTQRKLLELQAELEDEKLKRKAMEDEAATEKKKMKAMESAFIYLFQRQGEELPPDIAAGMRFVE
ncbi:hypothetical protein Ahy_A04g021462 [Arachis hypogaea]|uniref:Uncharacterized protein n=1 Tax=Arachis hypogaea TaxID=3818 RepID=A0A445DKF0_ARAHY|nr:hypothetical protein Ahy_A04g021462 [Arachis hypogaea]